GSFVIVEEGGVAAGVLRIEALTGAGAVHAQQEQRHALDRVLGALGVGEAQAVESVAKLQAEVKKLTRELRAARVSMATGPSAPAGQGATSSTSNGDDTTTIGGLAAVVRRADGLEKSELRDLSDAIKSKMQSGIVVLASATPDAKVAIVVSV